jgi:sugar lactone lactonase YvrE
LLIALAAAAGAQTVTGYGAADSAAMARASYVRSVAARRAGNLGQARDDAALAAAQWPTQPAYLLGWAAAAARVSDTAAVLRALEHYASLGLGRDVRADSLFAPYLRAPGFASVVDRLVRQAAPRAAGVQRATLPDSTFWPEGVDHDPRTNRYYLTSVRHGTVAELRPDGSWHELWPRGGERRGAVLAARVDTARNVLWAAVSGVPQAEGYRASDSSIAALVRVRLSDGTVERRWDLPPRAGGHVLGEVMLSPVGDVFMTDSNEPVLYRLRPGGQTLDAVRHPLFRSLQGIAVAEAGRVIYVADYAHGLLRVDLATDSVSRLADAPNSTSLGCDGIAYRGGAIIAVQNGVAPARLMRFVLDAGGRRIMRAEVLDQDSVSADEPTSVVLVGADAVYVADSQWEKYDAAGNRVRGTSLRPPVLISVSLPVGEDATTRR